MVKIVFIASLVVTSVILTAMTAMELGLRWPKAHWPRSCQFGDSSLGYSSINWMAGITFPAAVFICFVLV